MEDTLRPHFHISCGLEKQIQKSFELPLIRVGRLVIYSCSQEVLKKPFRAASYVRRMLIAVLTFLSFLNLSSKTFIYSKGFGCGNKLFSS